MDRPKIYVLYKGKLYLRVPSEGCEGCAMKKGNLDCSGFPCVRRENYKEVHYEAKNHHGK